MSVDKQHSLNMVAESVSQLIAVAKQWMLSQETRSTQQLVLTAERIKALDRLEKQIRKELKFAKGSSERVWQLVNIVIATVTRYILDRLSDSIQYQFRREQCVTICSLLTANSFIGGSYDRKNHKVFEDNKRIKTV